MIVAFHKPWGILSQFNENPDYPEQPTLSEFSLPENLSPVGRLDRDSEGLLLLSNDTSVERKLLHPQSAHRRTYLAQIENSPTEAELEILRKGGLRLKTHTALPCSVERIESPQVHHRVPPVRTDLATCWLELTLTEGKNRQVRRMTAAIGHPTLRLIRTSIEDIRLKDLAPGEWREIDASFLPC